jgi:tetratricopeptide (TPR) repeat protein
VNLLGELLLATRRFGEAQSVLGALFAEGLAAEGFDQREAVRGRLNYARVLAQFDPGKAGVLLEALLGEERARTGNGDGMTGRILCYASDCQRRLGNLQDALGLCDSGVAILRAAAPTEVRRLAESLRIRASVLAVADKTADAKSDYDEALALLNSAGLADHPDSAECYAGLAGVHLARNDVARAATEQRRALEIRQRSVGPGSPLAAETLEQLGRCMTRLGEYQEAEALLRECVSIQRLFASLEASAGLARGLEGLASCLEARGDISAAIPVLVEMIAVMDEMQAPDQVLAEARLRLEARRSEAAGSR